jgi:acyl-CoA synthetase (AMP-forming)/AMP-acid ligase II/acyl-CoA reductase-like NAD-dependent aldehyde dehydrogenase
MTVLDELTAAAERDPQRPFLRWWAWTPHDCEPVTLTYRDEVRVVGGLASWLRGAGVGVGARIAAVLPNGPDLVHLWFATAALGAVFIPLDPRLTAPELSGLLASARPDLLLVSPERGELPSGEARVVTVGDGQPDLGRRAVEEAAGWRPRSVSARLPAAVLYTSGSTGQPKGVLLTQESLLVPARHMASRLGLTADDVLLHVLPLHHMAGLSFLSTGVAAGATVALRPRFSGSRFWSDAVTGQATVVRHLGEMMAVLCHQPPGPDDTRHQLRLAYGAGASPAVAATFTERFGVRTLQGYGLSETNTVLCGDPDSPPDVLGTALPHLQVRLVDAGGTEVIGTGVGELQVHRNPALTLGYLAAPRLTARAFHGPWFRTGDLVSRGSDGQLRFISRNQDVIRRRGENIDPAEIERAVESTPGVRRAAAVGVAGELCGTEIQVFVETDPAARVNAADIRDRCAELLAPFKRPGLITAVPRLPLTRTSKVDKPKLRRWAADASVAAGLPGRLAVLQALGLEIEHRAAELEQLAQTMLPYPRSVIRADIALAGRRLAAFGSLLPGLAGRHPIGTTALSLPGNAILSNPVAAVGSSYLAGNRTLARFQRRRAEWAAVVAKLLTAALGDTVQTSDQSGQRFIETALADDAVQVLMVFGDDRWAAGYETAARRTGTKFIFEGPGKDPFLVLDPALAGPAAEAAAVSGLYNAGQACTAPERLYVINEAYPEFTDALVAAVEGMSAGHPREAGTQIGPLDQSGAARVLRQLQGAAAAGARVVSGGAASPLIVNGEQRVLVTPAVVTDAQHSMSLLREETFGPVLPVVRVGSAEEALRLAEDSPYGLSATVYGGPPWVRSQLAMTHGDVYRDETWLNRRVRAPVAPHGGRRRSGWIWEWRGDQFIRRDGPVRTTTEFSRPTPNQD